MRQLNILLAFVILILITICQFGGLGSLIAFGYVGEYLHGKYPWIHSIWIPLFYTWVLVWCVGLVICLARIKSIIREITNPSRFSLNWKDYIVCLGHLLFVFSFVTLLFENEFVYFGQTIAMAFYTGGLAVISLE